MARSLGEILGKWARIPNNVGKKGIKGLLGKSRKSVLL